MDGFQLAAAFQSREPMRHVILVALTGLSDHDSQEQGRQAGFAAYLCKPVFFAEMEAVLAAARCVTPGG
jgi:CheY-like chemotaxis protein